MTLDHFKRRQRACKIISLKDFPRNHPNRVKLWREVELLRKTSHVSINDHFHRAKAYISIA